ncbi:hypothetical protein [Methylotenera sp. 1P/1]|uniref:hypothetical protein n=1 Tax=Methylotenera sp. 1P/1 TaxID=1131551 RepID=UPI0012F743E2|nr:hypothetical protein [Methylotenera sp. 1P/1]
MSGESSTLAPIYIFGSFMSFSRWALLPLILSALIGCASAPPMQKATLINSNQENKLVYAKPDLNTQLNHLQKGINEDNTLLYFQNQGGGGLALGLMGPFGVLANMKMIEANTNKDLAQLRGKLMPNPHVAFQQAADSLQMVIENKPSPQDIRVTPVILISKTDPSTFHISAITFFEGGSDKDKWTHRYQYQLPDQYTLEQLVNLTTAQISDIQTQSAAGFTAILRQVNEETDVNIAKEKKIIFESAYFSPRWTYEMLGSLAGEKDGRIWVRTFGGLTAINPKDVKIKPQ